jgi:predicted DNA-binding transcriptional regulator AlpA
MNSAGERLLTLKEIQEIAKTSRTTVWRWTQQHGLKTIRIAGCVRVRERDWLEWLEKHSTSGNGTESGEAGQ